MPNYASVIFRLICPNCNCYIYLDDIVAGKCSFCQGEVEYGTKREGARDNA